MTMRTTGGSPAPLRRRAERFGPPPPATDAPPSVDGEAALDDTAQVDEPATTPDPVPPPSDTEQQPVEAPRETRREVREARHRRRQLLAACAIVVAVCLLLTILIVSMARQRPSGLPAATQASASAAPRAGAVITRWSIPEPIPSHGAVAPRGGHH
jgi:outer membrane biosynthesis protein TonB